MFLDAFNLAAGEHVLETGFEWMTVYIDLMMSKVFDASATYSIRWR